MKSIIIVIIGVLALAAAAAPAPVMLCVKPEQIETAVNTRLREGWKVQHQSIIYRERADDVLILVTLVPPTEEEAKRILAEKIAERELKRAEFIKKQEEMSRNVEAPAAKPPSK